MRIGWGGVKLDGDYLGVGILIFGFNDPGLRPPSLTLRRTNPGYLFNSLKRLGLEGLRLLQWWPLLAWRRQELLALG